MKLSLKYLILSVALLSIVLTLFGSVSSAFRMSKQTLIDNTLETNRVYAQKLASSTEVYFTSTIQQLSVSSAFIASILEMDNNADELLIEADRLKNQTDTFNSVVIAKENGEIVATSPQSLDLVGRVLDSEGGKRALTEKKPLISKPYLSLTGRLIIFISHPIFNEAGEYLGLVGGTLYLKETNILYDLLGEHYYNDGSYVFVVDEDGRIIYHRDQERINDVVTMNPIVQHVTSKESGVIRVTNSQGVEMLAGYANVDIAGWGIVSQRPMTTTLIPANEMIQEMVIHALPYLLLTIVIIFVISRFIAHPLQRLAHLTSSSPEKDQRVGMSKVRAWYYEAIQLKKALTYSLGFFHDKVEYVTYQSQTDPLTKLTNRRTLDEQLMKYTESNTPFAIVLIDIDCFKLVNDTYGHSVGDEVLKFLAQKMRAVAREEDICCRYGGEEFVLVLHHMDIEEALQVANTFRVSVEQEVSPSGEHITISAGIASYPESDNHIKAIIELADKSLYEAKRTGRNRCIAATKIKQY